NATLLQKLLRDKTDELERSVKDLNEKLSSALSECKANDDLAKNHAKVAEEALAGWEKAESEAGSLKQEVDEALQKRREAEERSAQLDAALKECIQQLSFVRKEQEQRVQDALQKMTLKHENVQKILEEKLSETNMSIAKLEAQSSHLSHSLQNKEKLIDDLNEQNSQAEAHLKALIDRINSTEKDNASLNYELRMIETELEIRSEEREFNRRSADASHKQHLESVKKIAKLETECQKLRVLVKKRLPGPAALAKMKTEVEMMGREPTETKRRNLNSPKGGSMARDFAQDSSLESPNKRINYLIERLCTTEEENKTLKETVSKKDEELQSARIMCAQSNSRLSKVETQIEELSKSQTSMELARNSPLSHDFCLTSISEDNNDEDADPWASALVSELEHLRNEKPRRSPSSNTFGGSEISLIEFAEMEQLALLSADKSSRSSHVSSDELLLSGKELVPISSSSESPHTPKASSIADSSDMNVTPKEVNSFNRASDMNISLEEIKSLHLHSSLSESISKITQLVEGINRVSVKDNSSSYTNSVTDTSYTVRVFQWKSSELDYVLRLFVHACNDLLNGKSSLGKFAGELSSAFDWIVNHCFSLQDVSSMRDTITKHFDWDESRSESEPEKVQVTSMEGLKDQNKRLRDDLATMESLKNFFEEKLQSATGKIEALMNQLQESEKSYANLQTEIEALNGSKRVIEDEVEKHKLLYDALQTQLTNARVELNEAREKVSSLDVELEDKSTSCQELEATCLDLQLHLESLTKNENTEKTTNQEEKRLQTDLEISAASERLAECQETIFNLAKQFQALSAPKESVILDKVIPIEPSPIKNMNHRSSLLGQMLVDDGANPEDLNPPKMKEIICTMDSQKHRSTYSSDMSNVALKSLAIVPIKKRGGSGGFLRKLMSRRKRGNANKMPLPLVVV
ncbi:hypothetical protein GIB67_016289, partial [Kingdonia uniflora]